MPSRGDNGFADDVREKFVEIGRLRGVRVTRKGIAFAVTALIIGALVTRIHHCYADGMALADATPPRYRCLILLAGFVGLGNMGMSHALAYASIDGFEVGEPKTDEEDAREGREGGRLDGHGHEGRDGRRRSLIDIRGPHVKRHRAELEPIRN